MFPGKPPKIRKKVLWETLKDFRVQGAWPFKPPISPTIGPQYWGL